MDRDRPHDAQSHLRAAAEITTARNSGGLCRHRQLALFPADRPVSASDTESVQVRLDELGLENPRQWGACWLADHLWRTLHLDDFFGARLGVSREGTDWKKVLRISRSTACSRRVRNGGCTVIGNYNPPVSIFGRHLEALGISSSRVAGVMNWVDVPLTTPIVATSVVGVYAPAYVSTYNQSRGRAD